MFWRHNLLPLGLTLLVSLLCLTPGGDMPGSPFISFDKLSHAAFFMLLFFQWSVGLRKQDRFIWWRRHSFALAFFGCLAYGGLLELLQGLAFESRSADWKDFLADAIGVGAGAVFYVLLFGKDGFRLGMSHRNRWRPKKSIERF